MPQTMTLGEQLQRFLTIFDISHADPARVVGISDRTVMRWLADEMYPQHGSRRKLDQLDALVQRLDESSEHLKAPQPGSMRRAVTSAACVPSTLCSSAATTRSTPLAKRLKLVCSCKGNLIVFPDRLRWKSSIGVIDSQDPNLFVDWGDNS